MREQGLKKSLWTVFLSAPEYDKNHLISSIGSGPFENDNFTQKCSVRKVTGPSVTEKTGYEAQLVMGFLVADCAEGRTLREAFRIQLRRFRPGVRASHPLRRSGWSRSMKRRMPSRISGVKTSRLKHSASMRRPS